MTFVGSYPLGKLTDKLYSSVISDVLDDLGFRHQTLDPGLTLIDETQIVCERAFTAVAAEVFNIPKEPYKLQMEAVDAVRPVDSKGRLDVIRCQIPVEISGVCIVPGENVVRMVLQDGMLCTEAFRKFGIL